jgi:hypothetical protein
MDDPGGMIMNTYAKSPARRSNGRQLRKEKSMYTHVRKKGRLLKRKANIRVNHGERDELERLARSYITRPVHPFIIVPGDEIADGNRRHMGMELIGELDREVDCLQIASMPSPLELVKLQAVSAIHRRGLSGYEQWQVCEKLKSLKPELTNVQLAADLEIDNSLCTKILSPSKTIPEVQEALKQERITLSHVYAISRVPHEQQQTLLEMAIAGCPKEELTQRVRKNLTGSSGEKVTTARVKIELPGASIVVTRKALDMSGLVALLADCLKKAKDAEGTYNVKTFQAMMRDKARGEGSNGALAP